MEKKNTLRNIIIVIVILVGYTIFWMYSGEEAPSIRFASGTTAFTLSGGKDSSMSFDLTSLTGLSLEDAAYGTAIDGIEAQGYLSGSWNSPVWGEYQAFVKADIPLCILFKEEENAAAFNVENEKTTRDLYEQLTALREQNAEGSMPRSEEIADD